MENLLKFNPVLLSMRPHLKPAPGKQLMDVSLQNQLLKKIAKERCSQSFSLIFDHYLPRLMAFAQKGSLSESQSKELVQEVMTKVWLKAEQFNEEKGEANTWIFSIARNARFDVYRKNSRDSIFVQSEDIWSYLEDAPSLENFELKLQNQELQQEVENLPPLQRDVIESVYFLGLTQEECAQEKNIPLGTVKSRIRLALKKLSQVIEK